MPDLRLYNTLTRTVEPFRPARPPHVRIYVCGLTPSAEPHLGHARSFLFFDVLRRWLAHPRHGYEVTYVRNLTDIDDRSIRTAADEGTTYDAVVARYVASFQASMAKLDVAAPDLEPRVTAFIPQIVEMIGQLVASGHAYATEDGVYYRVASFPAYGKLSRKSTDELLVGARIAADERKDDPLDFALWKRAKPGEPGWPSPWGDGRPGWHIECSAMARAVLGVPLDVHGGGYDLVFPHHENEIAQSEPLMTEGPFSRVWLHGGLLNFDNRKMSKSLGNFEPLSALVERHDPLAIRLLFLQTGYRKPMNFTEASIAAATVALERLERAHRELAAMPPGAHATRDAAEFAERFARALDDDMNTAGAVSVLFDLANERASIADPVAALAVLDDAFAVLGLGRLSERARSAASRGVAARALDPAIVERLRDAVGDAVHVNGGGPESAIAAVIEARATAKKARDFALADRLRAALAAAGIAVVDTKEGTTWTVDGG